MKITQKFINKISKFTDDFSRDAAQVAVNISLEKDIYVKSKKYRSVIKELYPIYMNKYIKICKYLYEDFNIHFARFGNDKNKTDISKELQLKSQVKKILRETENKKVNFIDRFNVNKNIKRWWVLSTILQNYQDALQLLIDNSTSRVYKDIDFEEELEEYEKNKYLIEDFSVLREWKS